MVTVLLPTRRWTPACDEVASQLNHGDELLLICDSSDDPLVSSPEDSTSRRPSMTSRVDSLSRRGAENGRGRGNPSGCDLEAGGRVKVLVAGEPSRCSGKANAIAHGIEHSNPTQDRFVWTDGDFIHGADWLSRMKALGERYGAVSGIPVFVSAGGWVWRLFEPATTVCGSLSFYTANRAWGGSVTFTRDQVDLDGLVTDLRRTISDDTLLWEYLGRGDRLTTTRELVYEVPVPGTLKEALRRTVRFNKILYHFARAEVVGFLVAGLLFYAVTVVAPLFAAGLATAVAAGTYRFLGVKRWTFLLAFPAFLLLPVVLGYSIFVDEFTWTDRRYQWNSKFDVFVESVADKSSD